jgi:hypothetical protein
VRERAQSAGNEKKKEKKTNLGRRQVGKGSATHANSNKKGPPTRFCKREGTRATVKEVVSEQKEKGKEKEKKKRTSWGAG